MVGADAVDAGISPIASGWPCQSTTSHVPPASRTKAHTHSAARWTSGACSGSALIDGMRRKPESSSNHSTSRETSGGSGDVAELLRLGERAELLQALVLDLANALACHLERPPHLVERARLFAVQSV